MATDAHEIDDYQIQGPSAESRCLDATGTAQDKSSPNEPSSVLHTSSLIVLLASCYAAAAVFAWVIICISTTRPIFAHGYQYKVTSRLNTPEIYAKSERLVKTARVVGTIVSVITIPLTSAVCAQAAVVFLQQPRRGGKSPTLRQTMALADKSWNDPLLIFKLVAGQWSKYGSRFLAAAIVLNILGITVAPLQEIFVSYKTIKAAVYPYLITDIFDLVDAFEQEGSQSMDDDFTTFLTRSKLTSTRRGDAQPQLWSDKTDHNAMGIHGLDTDLLYTAARQHSFDNMTVLKNPFWAALPAGFSSGLIRQYVPRFNFSAKAEQITSDSFPSDCSSDPQALHLYYNKSSDARDKTFAKNFS
ncbi:hypothetical protein CDD82_5223 [Ophiocordyceps australis]|uniref:Uncharacterized protein n=1 Tax=Ophiocordyceps australis TaxID=1399860 RepID=A0A2C5Z293_9HYPO|nr:hypothetical protein CDD82_5223 [Ophiocordyceps australis]